MKYSLVDAAILNPGQILELRESLVHRDFQPTRKVPFQVKLVARANEFLEGKVGTRDKRTLVCFCTDGCCVIAVEQAQAAVDGAREIFLAELRHALRGKLVSDVGSTDNDRTQPRLIIMAQWVRDELPPFTWSQRLQWLLSWFKQY